MEITAREVAQAGAALRVVDAVPGPDGRRLPVIEVRFRGQAHWERLTRRSRGRLYAALAPGAHWGHFNRALERAASAR